MRIYLISVRYIFIILALLVSSQAYAQFNKSSNDHREYRALELENRIRVLLISDSEADEAAAALALRVGGQDDPEDWQGMAHYLEHMLFLGTEKYPELDGYRTFIEQNGGFSNAYTAIDVTNYNFSIEPEFLEPALDRFAQFFISPLFPPEQIARERAVVDAEYEMRTQRDAVRRWAAMRHTYNPKHPAAKFVSGTEETLQGDVRSELIKFFDNRYSANLMNLVVLGRESLDELENLVEELFVDVTDKDAEELKVSEPLYTDGTLPAVLKIKTLKNNPNLTLMFPVPDLEPYWRESPDGYVSHLLGHEGKGSLLSELKDQGWADGLYVSPSNAGQAAYTINVRVSLTQKGYENWESVAAYVFQYIREIRKRGIDEWRFNEQKILSEISFRFSELDDIRDFVTFLASALHKYPRNEILTALYLVINYDPQLIAGILDHMKPNNVLAILASPTVETDHTTPYIGAEYAVTSLSADTVKEWNADIADSSDWLPQQNDFLPQDLELKNVSETAKPEKLIDRPGFALWHQTDTSFDVPRSSFFVSVRSPVTKASVKDSVLLSLFTASINDQLNEFAYPASLAGLEYSLYGHSRGFSIRLSGYDDKLSVLLKEIVNAVKSPSFDRERFEVHRQQLIRDVENSRRDSAYRRTISEFYSIIVQPNWTEEEELQALAEVTFDNLAEFSERILDQVNIVALSHGNVLSESTVQMGEIVTTSLLNPQKIADVKKSDIAVLPENGPFFRPIEIENSDSAISVYLQGANRSIPEYARFSLLAQIIQSPFFSDLRTVQQLGYVVFATLIPVGEIPGLIFIIQSPDVLPDDMQSAIDEFLDNFHSWLAEIPDEEFEAYRNGLLGLILEKDSTLNDRSERYWSAIDRKDYDFDRREELAAALEKIEKTTFEKFVLDLIDGKRDSRLTVLGYGNNHGLPEEFSQIKGIRIEDREAFKNDLEYFPQY